MNYLLVSNRHRYEQYSPYLTPIGKGRLHNFYLGTSFGAPAENAHRKLFECARLESAVAVICDGLGNSSNLVGVLLIEADVDYRILQVTKEEALVCMYMVTVDSNRCIYADREE